MPHRQPASSAFGGRHGPPPLAEKDTVRHRLAALSAQPPLAVYRHPDSEFLMRSPCPLLSWLARVVACAVLGYAFPSTYPRGTARRVLRHPGLLLLALFATSSCRDAGPVDPTRYPSPASPRRLSGTVPPSGCGRLLPSEAIERDQSVESCNGTAMLALQSDQNLVLYDPAGAAWSAPNTINRGTAVLVMQADGNLVAYNEAGQWVWSSGTQGNPDAWLQVQDDCNMVIYRAPYPLGGGVLWASNTSCRAPRPDNGRMLPGDQLSRGVSFTSGTGNAILQVQYDQNVVLYKGQVPLWSAPNTLNRGTHALVMQYDGNLVAYNGAWQPLWASGTSHQGAWLALQDDCNLVIYRGPYPQTNGALWATGTSCGTAAPPELLAAPSLVSPGIGATRIPVNPTFSWSAVSGADRYWVMVATHPSVFPTDPNATTCPGCVISGNTGSTSYAIPAAFPYSGRTTSLNANTRYYWKVQAWTNSPRRQGSYPAAASFTTAGPVGSPPLTCPPNWTPTAGNGVLLCRRDLPLSGGTETQYVVQVNLRQGGRIMSLYNALSPFTFYNRSPLFSMLTVDQWWDNYGPHADWFCLLNGAPFESYADLTNDTTQLSFPIRDNGNLVTVGGEMSTVQQKSALLLYTDRASIVDYPLYGGAELRLINNALPAPVAVVSLNRNYPAAGNTSSHGQTFVAVKDADHDGLNEIVLFYVTLKASRTEVNTILTRDFEISSSGAMQLDGGTSSQLRCTTDAHIAERDRRVGYRSARPVPHVFLVLQAGL